MDGGSDEGADTGGNDEPTGDAGGDDADSSSTPEEPTTEGDTDRSSTDGARRESAASEDTARNKPTETGAGTSDEMDEAEPDEAGRIDLTRRQALQGGGLVAGGFVVGLVFPESRSEWCTTTVDAQLGGAQFERRFWLGDHDELQRRPLWSLSLPGTHHASFYELTDNWAPVDVLSRGHVERWTRPQSNDVATQLADGIRYLDVRPHFDPEADPTLWAHHDIARGPPLEAIVSDLGEFLAAANREAGGNEFVLVKLSGFDGFDEEGRRQLRTLLERHLGPYALELPEREPAATLERSLSSFDGPRVGLLYDGFDPWAGVADERERWLRDGWMNESGLEGVHGSALELTHTDTDRLGETGYYVTPATGDIATSVVTGWVPGSSRWRAYRSLREAARRMSTRLPCYLSRVTLDSALNPNVLTVDHYDTGAVVRACRELSLRGLHETFE
jgi:hypothetical protein